MAVKSSYDEFSWRRLAIHRQFERDQIDIVEFGQQMAVVNREELISKGEYFAVGMPITTIASRGFRVPVERNDGKIQAHYPDDKEGYCWDVVYPDGSWEVYKTDELRWR